MEQAGNVLNLGTGYKVLFSYAGKKFLAGNDGGEFIYMSSGRETYGYS